MSRWLQLRSSWFWLGLSGALIVLIAIASLRPTDTRGPLSPRNANSDGGLALYLWLGKISYHVQDITSSFNTGDLPRSGATLMLLPGSDLTLDGAANVLGWVRESRNRLVLVTDGSTGSAILKLLDLRVVATPNEHVVVAEPLLLNPPVSHLDGNASQVLADLPAGGEAAQTSSGPVLIRRVAGRGEIWVLTTPQLLDNAHLPHQQNSRLAMNLAGPRGGALFFDEYIPNPPTGNSNWLTGTTWGALMWFVLAILLLYRWLAGRRLGPAVVPISEGHRAATEYVISIARLLRRGHKRREVLATYQSGLRRAIRERFGAEESEHLNPELRRTVESLLASVDPRRDADLLRLTAEIVQCEVEVRSGRV